MISISPKDERARENFVREGRAWGIPFSEIEKQLLRAGVFYYASEAHAFVKEMQRREEAEHARIKKAARTHAWRQIAGIGIGLAMIAAFIVYPEIRRGDLASSLLFGAAGLIFGCGSNLARLYLSRHDYEALAKIAAPKEKDQGAWWSAPNEGLDEIHNTLFERRAREALDAQRAGMRPM